MDDHITFPDDRDSKRKVITEGFFEREVQLSRARTAEFLRELAAQVESDGELTISTADWEIPFAYGEPIEVEVEFTGGHRKELEIELEFTEPRDADGLSVE